MAHVAGRGKDDAQDLSDYQDMLKESPFLSGVLVLGLASLAGIPPLAGFIGKLLLFYAAFQAELYTLLVVAIVGVADFNLLLLWLDQGSDLPFLETTGTRWGRTGGATRVAGSIWDCSSDSRWVGFADFVARTLPGTVEFSDRLSCRRGFIPRLL